MRDENGNEKETVEITTDRSDGREYSRDLGKYTRVSLDLHNGQIRPAYCPAADVYSMHCTV